MGPTQKLVKQTPAVAVIKAIASASGRSSEELPPLYETIDPDALNTLFGPKGDASQSTVKVTFMYYGYEVTVEGTGQVTVSEK